MNNSTSADQLIPNFRNAPEFAQALLADVRLIFAKYNDELYQFVPCYFKKISFEDFSNIISYLYYPVTIRHSLNFLKETYKRLLMHPYIYSVPENDADKHIMFPNGVYSIEKDTFIPGTQIMLANSYQYSPAYGNSIYRYFGTSYISVNYPFQPNNQADFMVCPKFTSFLNQISGGDTELIMRLWEFLGYYLTPDMNCKCFVVLYGVGDSGKSVLSNFLASFFNTEAVTTITIDDFHSTVFSKKLYQRRLALSLELSSDAIDNKIVRGIKNATGNDLLTASGQNFRNKCKLLFASNYPLITKSPSVEFMNRFVPIPFKYSIPKAEQIPNLIQEFESEKPAIVYNALQAYRRLKANGYQFSGNFPKNDPELFPDFDPYGNKIVRFLRNKCIIGNKEDRTLTSVLFESFQNSEFCDPELEIELFGRKLKQVLTCVYPDKTEQKHWYVDTVDGKKVYQWGYIGISLVKDSHE